MARPTHIRDEDLISAAREVFLSNGLQATSAQVAERAGVSEGTLFKRFGTKLELFRAAMQPQLEESANQWVERLELAAKTPTTDMRSELVVACRSCLSFFERLMPLMMMSWSNQHACGLPESLAGENPPPVRLLRRLTTAYEALMKEGRLREADPEMAARMLLSGCQSYVFFSMLRAPLASADTYIDQLVDFMWSGLRP